MTKIGEVVVVGGVRRSAMISLSDLDDIQMREAKMGEWWVDNPHFALANNSVAYSGKPDPVTFIAEWSSLIDSGSGERGIFNRKAVQDRCLADGKRDPEVQYGTNPCSEIVLAPHQFCNLTEVCVRQGDTMDAICRKLRLASILGTIQASFTHFPYLRPIWKETTEKEALLGVSMTGIMDNALTNGKKPNLDTRLKMFRKIAVDTNEYYAKRLGINQAAAVTAVKPSGTVSQLCDTASGIHARYAKHYIRTVRGDNKDPLTQFMIDQGIPNEPCVMKPEQTTVFSFPMKSPDGSVTRWDMTAIDQLEMWLAYQRYFTCHKPSVTIDVLEHEWVSVGAWVYEHFEEMSGVSFLPRTEHTYQQAPYQDCTANDYVEAKRKMPSRIDWSKLTDYEKEDTTKGSQTMACVGGVCELVDIEAA